MSAAALFLVLIAVALSGDAFMRRHRNTDPFKVEP